MRVKRVITIFLVVCFIQACHIRTQPNKGISSHQSYPLADLPVAITNNAVAQVEFNKQQWLFSFNGLKADKTWQDVTNQSFVFVNNEWRELDMPTTVQPVLASVAVSVGSSVYLLGGYTVAEDHTEVSTPYIHKLSVPSLQWEIETSMPTPVDDAVALVYKERYIYVVSGWHDTDNVDLVQIYDTFEKKWSMGTDFPLPPVFGHSGGIIDNKMLICDGVKVDFVGNKKQFNASPECILGVINPENISEINWKNVSHYSGKAHYRMGALAVNKHFVFAGGSDNPYNYNGIGYNQVPSQASSQVRTYSHTSGQWTVFDGVIEPTMDHRGLLYIDGSYILIGGMSNNQEVIKGVNSFTLEIQ